MIQQGRTREKNSRDWLLNAIKRARNRAWTDFVVDFSRTLGTVTYARTNDAFDEALDKVIKTLDRLEDAIDKERGNERTVFLTALICRWLTLSMPPSWPVATPSYLQISQNRALMVSILVYRDRLERSHA